MRALPTIKVKIEVSSETGISLQETSTLHARNVKLNGEILQALNPIIRNLSYDLVVQLFNQLEDV